MKIRPLHRWPTDAKAAIALQRALAGRVRAEPLPASVRLLAGCDLALMPDEKHVVAGVVVWDMQTQAAVERRIARCPARFPYVPGLLSFRELPAVLAACKGLRTRPDAVLCDGQGLAHPRRFGLACHLGVWLDLPTIGCAKSRLCGTFEEPGLVRGSRSPLRCDGDIVGAVLRTRDRVRPLYVSLGHHCDLDGAVRLTLAAATRYRLPEPTRLAHQLVTAARRGLA